MLLTVAVAVLIISLCVCVAGLAVVLYEEYASNYFNESYDHINPALKLAMAAGNRIEENETLILHYTDGRVFSDTQDVTTCISDAHLRYVKTNINETRQFRMDLERHLRSVNRRREEQLNLNEGTYDWFRWRDNALKKLAIRNHIKALKDTQNKAFYYLPVSGN